MIETAFNNRHASVALTTFIPADGVYPTSGGNGMLIGEIGLFAGNFSPNGSKADGSLLSTSTDNVLFSLIGTTYGGDGVGNFAVPDLQDRTMVGIGQGTGLPNQTLGEPSGSDSKFLAPVNTPPHNGGTSQPFDNYGASLGIDYRIQVVGTFPSTSGGADLDSIGMVVPFALNAAPDGAYLPCDGRLLNIADYTALFNLIGTTYGGDGMTTFALPDLRGRDIVGASSTLPVGTKVGQASVALTNDQTPDSFGGTVQPLVNQPQPGLALNYIIATIGIFPQRDRNTGDEDLPLYGQVMAFAGNFVPKGWALCDGSVISIAQNTALFSLLGTFYGGNGFSTFALPDLRGRSVIGTSATTQIGTVVDGASPTLTSANLPSIDVHTLNPAGFTLDQTYSILNVFIDGSIGTTGVTTSKAHPWTINNIGSTQGSPYGINVGGGAVINNGVNGYAGSLISGDTGIIFKGRGIVTNYATIQGTAGVAIKFDSKASGNKLIEEASGTIIGAVAGGGGVLELANDFGPGTLTGLGTTLKGFATVTVDSSSYWTLSGPSTVQATTELDIKGVLNVAGQVTNSGIVAVQPGGILAFQGDVGIAGAGAFSNAGTLEKQSGTGTSILHAASIVSTGPIDVEAGTLRLSAPSVALSGQISGPGTIEFGVGSTMLTGASYLTTGAVKITGTGAHVTAAHSINTSSSFTAGANTELTVTAGNILQLSGFANFVKAKVDGDGQLVTSGSTAFGGGTLGGALLWNNSGNFSATGNLVVGAAKGDSAQFVNLAGGTVNLSGKGTGVYLGAPGDTIFTNQGLVVKTAGGTSVIGFDVDNTGTIEASNGVLDITAEVTGTGGTLKIDAGKALELDSPVSAGQTVAFNGGKDKLILTQAAAFSGKLSNFGLGDRLDLTEFNPATMTVAFTEDASNTFGTLQCQDGGLTANIVMLGQYSTAQFHKATDGKTGTLLTAPPLPDMTTTLAPST